MSGNTLWWLVPLIGALILYPIWGLIPRGREAKQLKFRQMAREAGLLVQIPRVKKPDGRVAIDMAAGKAEYCLALPMSAVGHWRATYDQFDVIQPCGYQPESAVSDFFGRWLVEHDGELAISQRGKQLVALWDERGTEISLQRTIELLNHLKQLQEAG